MDTVRYSYLLDKLVQHSCHTLFVGPTGCCTGMHGGTGNQEEGAANAGALSPVITMLLTFKSSTRLNCSALEPTLKLATDLLLLPPRHGQNSVCEAASAGGAAPHVQHHVHDILSPDQC